MSSARPSRRSFFRRRHDATVTFDKGNPNLAIEAAESLEVSCGVPNGPFRFEATAFTDSKGSFFAG
jgi:hypothetical protein